MKVSLSILSLALSTLVASEGLSFFGGSQKSLADEPVPVPGDNPLTYCNPPRPDDILVLENVDLSPNPPEAFVAPIHLFERSPN